MYDELVKALRGCVLSKPCDGCPYYDKTGPTEKCATMNIAAADAIEELSKPRWIPVKERLPELHDAEYLDEVTGELIRYKESKPIMIWLEKGGFMDIGIYEKSDAVDDFCYQGVPATVTYWQPLLEPPKEG